MQNSIWMPHEAVVRHDCVIDFDHLDQYTLGDRALQSELLHLFQAQLDTQSGELAQCSDARRWKQAAHTLKGAARAVGAWQVAGVAEKLEELDFEQRAERLDLLEDLAAARHSFTEGLLLLID